MPQVHPRVEVSPGGNSPPSLPCVEKVEEELPFDTEIPPVPKIPEAPEPLPKIPEPELPKFEVRLPPCPIK